MFSQHYEMLAFAHDQCFPVMIYRLINVRLSWRAGCHAAIGAVFSFNDKNKILQNEGKKPTMNIFFTHSLSQLIKFLYGAFENRRTPPLLLSQQSACPHNGKTEARYK